MCIHRQQVCVHIYIYTYTHIYIDLSKPSEQGGLQMNHGIHKMRSHASIYTQAIINRQPLPSMILAWVPGKLALCMRKPWVLAALFQSPLLALAEVLLVHTRLVVPYSLMRHTQTCTCTHTTNCYARVCNFVSQPRVSAPKRILPSADEKAAARRLTSLMMSTQACYQLRLQALAQKQNTALRIHGTKHAATF